MSKQSKSTAARWHSHPQFIRAMPAPFNSYSEQKFLQLGRKGERAKHALRYLRGPDGVALWLEDDLIQYARDWLFRSHPALADQFAVALSKLPANT